MLYKKYSSPFDQYTSLLQEYYHVTTNIALLRALWIDSLLALFLRSGSGLITSVIKGMIGKFFVKSGFPLLIGKRVKIMHPYNMKFGNHVWVRDDVILVANGPMNIGNNAVIGENTTIWAEKKGLVIGNGVGIGKHCYIAQLGGTIKIGNDVLIADSVRIYSATHKYEDITKIILLQGYEEFTIDIKDNVWIGSGAIIFNDVTIGTGSVIGANSVVTKDVPPYTVVAGAPAKVIKKLKIKKHDLT